MADKNLQKAKALDNQKRKITRFKNDIKEAFDDVKAGRVKSVRTIK